MNLIEWKSQEKRGFQGWDFSEFKLREQPLPWKYTVMARQLIRKSKSVLDMGTGGGELFSTLGPFPKHTVATEGYNPNFIVARRNLRRLGIRVVDFSNASLRKMPFKDDEFQLILNRHDAFDLKEVHRILAPDGVFLTQQVGRDDLKDLAKSFGAVSDYRNTTFNFVKSYAKNLGFGIEKENECRTKIEFDTVGILVYFLTAIPWVVPGFSVNKNLRHLEKLQKKLDRGGKLVFTQHRYLLQLRK